MANYTFGNSGLVGQKPQYSSICCEMRATITGVTNKSYTIYVEWYVWRDGTTVTASNQSKTVNWYLKATAAGATKVDVTSTPNYGWFVGSGYKGLYGATITVPRNSSYGNTGRIALTMSFSTGTFIWSSGNWSTSGTVTFYIPSGVMIYSGGWKLGIPYVYSGGWKLCNAMVYSGGWKMSGP